MHGDLLVVPVLGEEGRRRRSGQVDECGKLVRHVLEQVAPATHHLDRLFAGVEDETAEHDGTDWMQGEFESGDDPEVAAAAPERPEQLRILRLGGVHDRSVGGYHFNGEEVVAGEPVFADQVAEAAAQGEAADTGAGNQPSGCRQSVLLGGRVECLPFGSAAGECSPRLNINLDVVQLRKIDDDPVVTGGEAGNAVGTAAYRDRPSFTSGKSDGSHHILGGRAAYDQCGPFVDGVVPDATGRLVARVPGPTTEPAKPISNSRIVASPSTPVTDALPPTSDSHAGRLGRPSLQILCKPQSGRRLTQRKTTPARGA